MYTGNRALVTDFFLSFSDRLSTTLHKIHYESHTRENMPPILQFEFSTNVPCYCITLEKSSLHCIYGTRNVHK